MVASKEGMEEAMEVAVIHCRMAMATTTTLAVTMRDPRLPRIGGTAVTSKLGI
jgi:hypothetical protein